MLTLLNMYCLILHAGVLPLRFKTLRIFLCNLIVLEQFGSSLPAHLAVYINKKKAEAAVMAGECDLMHAKGAAIGRVAREGPQKGSFRFCSIKSPGFVPDPSSSETSSC